MSIVAPCNAIISIYWVSSTNHSNSRRRIGKIVVRTAPNGIRRSGSKAWGSWIITSNITKPMRKGNGLTHVSYLELSPIFPTGE